MSGICSAHRHHEPTCEMCNAIDLTPPAAVEAAEKEKNMGSETRKEGDAQWEAVTSTRSVDQSRCNSTPESPTPPASDNRRVIGGIIIPNHPPPGVVEILGKFVDAVYDYEETGVWPDNWTFRKLAEEGMDALGGQGRSGSTNQEASPAVGGSGVSLPESGCADASAEQECDLFVHGGDLDVRLYAHDDRTKWRYLIHLQDAKHHALPFIKAANEEVERLVASLRAALAQSEQEKRELREAATEALLALAVLKLSDLNKPYIEIGDDLRRQIFAAHDQLLVALKPASDNHAEPKEEK